MSVINSSNTIDLLKDLSGYLGDDFNLDDCNMIDQFLTRIPLNSFVYECLKFYEREGIPKKGLSQKIVNLRKALSRHVDQRIYFLMHFSEINFTAPFLFDTKEISKIGNDPWLASIYWEGIGEDGDVSIAASLHVRDLLFTIRKILKIMPEKIEEFLPKLASFNTNELPSYLKLLANLKKSQKNEIKNKFIRLYTLLQDKDLDGIRQQTREIRRIFRSLSTSLFQEIAAS